MKSASSIHDIDFVSKVSYLYKLFLMRVKGGQSYNLIPWEDIREYESILVKYCPTKQRLVEHQVLEIGYGARPWRLLSMASLGVDIKGIDLDRPVYGLNLKRLGEALKYNGFERFIKSLVRCFLFDTRDLNYLKKELSYLNKKLTIDQSRMLIGNAAERRHFQDDSFTFVFSEDVFEHIPSADLPKVLSNIKNWLKNGGIFVVRPNVWTGISGGHDPDYYPNDIILEKAPHSKAWLHLLDPNFKVNTYLNRLRLQDYIELFSKEFEILEIKHKHDRLGEKYLTPDLFKRLSSTYSREELLTNQISFVLRA
ncbi:methyltransferase domain-containing protein [Spirosoma foliorum]|uniref:Methyltransferase domain-containing protein n=1 Tax=Spirosoma foliorum TaxID=2710596 RepID=A0A7G5GYN6_9BACT|nr:methyltransferase domain-containing protein [Spirosoma foliorum]QMW03978.1 methyltransferase domain-containing protein [Spirosoma foliorum]